MIYRNERSNRAHNGSQDYLEDKVRILERELLESKEQIMQLRVAAFEDKQKVDKWKKDSDSHN